MKWGGVILAGGLVPDPLASAIGTPRKALALIEGRTCLARTVDALVESGVSDWAVVGGEDMKSEVREGKLGRAGQSAIENARIGLGMLEPMEAVLFLPCDTPFLTGQALKDFMRAVEMRVGTRATPDSVWFAAGLADHAAFEERYPEAESTPIRLKEGTYLTGALYATNPDGFQQGRELFEEVSRSRRSQFQLAMRLGIGGAVRYFLHRLSLADAEQLLGRLLNGEALLIENCDPDAMFDIDEERDYRVAVRHAQQFGK